MHNMGKNVTGDELFWNDTERALLSTTLLVIMVVSVVGNSLVIVVVARNRGMRTRTNLFLCSLAVADLLCSVLAMPFSLAVAIRAEWIFNWVMCRATGFMTPLFIVASIHTLMYISVHRFVTVRDPHSRAMTRRRIVFMIIAAWAWAILASAVSISGLTEVNHSRYTTQCAPKYPDDAKSYAHLALAVLTCYIVPMIVIVACSLGVFRVIRTYGHHLRDSSTVDVDEIYAQQRHIAVTLVLVVVTFVVCWTPLVVYAIYSTLMRDEERIHHLANPICWWFGYLNSACNPIIYAFRSQAFREGYRQVICRSGKPPRRGSTSTMTSLSLRQRFSNLLKRDSTLSSNVFNASDSVVGPGTGTYRSDDDDELTGTALMSPAQRSASTRRGPVDTSSDLINMDSFRWKGTDDEDDEERHAKKIRYFDHDMDQSDADETQRSAGKPGLMSFPSLEHLDRMADGSPWKDPRRRKRRFLGGLGGLQGRGEAPREDDIELDRIGDDATDVPETNRKPSRTGSSISRTASAAAKQRDRQRGAAPAPAEPVNRIYNPARRHQPPAPAPLAPRVPAPVDRGVLRVVPEVPEATEGEEPRPRRQRRRRQRAEEGDPAETQPSAAAYNGTEHLPPVHNAPRRGAEDVAAVKQTRPEVEVSQSGRRQSSRRQDGSRAARRTEARAPVQV